ncbi:MAG TPA: aminotransferase class V-fold PLP-dependent enzyme [Chlamydiales bacterium]|nr:aminotransferase class V-fold PLP-dependent enzyme [Chlamydiales bacterium]
MIYLDAHSATPPCSAALERMDPYLKEHWGAGFAPHRMGQELIASLEPRYQMLYDFVDADPKDTFVFTSSGAEAANQVLWSVFLELARKEGKCHFITSCIEDAPTLQMLKQLEKLGCTVKIAPVNAQGQIDLEKLTQMINPRTALISVTLAQGLTGVIQPFEEIAKIAKEKNILLHLDGTYALGKFPFSFSDTDVDYLTFSGDRIHALKGSGGLFAKERRPLSPLILGGNEQASLRGGAFDIPSFVALSAAAQQASLYLDTMGLEVARLRNHFETQIAQEIPGAKPLFQESLRLPNTSVILFPKVHQEALLYTLNRKGLYASIGGPYAQHLSRLLIASGIPESQAESALAFSLSRMTTEEEINRAIRLIQDNVKPLYIASEAL